MGWFGATELLVIATLLVLFFGWKALDKWMATARKYKSDTSKITKKFKDVKDKVSKNVNDFTKDVKEMKDDITK